MKFLVVLVVAVACAAADSPPELKPNESEAPIIRSTFEMNPDGNSYQYAYETGNGISSQSEGVVKDPNSETPTLEAKGSYRYTSPDGVPVNVEWIANEKGYQAVGSHIPVPPPIPEAILRGLQYIAEHPAADEPVDKPYPRTA